MNVSRDRSSSTLAPFPFRAPRASRRLDTPARSSSPWSTRRAVPCRGALCTMRKPVMSISPRERRMPLAEFLPKSPGIHTPWPAKNSDRRLSAAHPVGSVLLEEALELGDRHRPRQQIALGQVAAAAAQAREHVVGLYPLRHDAEVQAVTQVDHRAHDRAVR